MDHEGAAAEAFLRPLGVAVFVLGYRVGPRYRYPIELEDAQRAMRVVRAHAADWGIDPHRIGIMGFSAGGHLAATVSTHFDVGSAVPRDSIDRVSSRPDFTILVYPVITLTEPWTHEGSKTNLLGATPDSALARSLSNDRMVTAQTPPTFLFHTNEDDGVPAENSIYYALALRRAGVPVELHLYQHGPHGTAMGDGDPVLGTWPLLLVTWLRTNGWIR